ncbi:dihydropteroate synthase [Planctomycetales bacterium ZRK34]|nr:dihydropteroate synthase [Planctomycetales bacterium ZRK34]
MQLTLTDDRVLKLDRPRLLGILNLTPDSFSDGGMYPSAQSAVLHAHQMIDDGADAIDLGAESTRPGAARIEADEQLARLLPVIEQLADQTRVPISIDTTRVKVAEAALDAGGSIINDVSAGRDDKDDMLRLIAERGCPIILMHMLGEPATMQNDPRYDNVVADVLNFLLSRAEAAQQAGVKRQQIVIDPGIGFGKTLDHNLALLAGLDEFVAAGYPVLLGTSRKGFLGTITGARQPADRAAATAATTAIGVAAGVQMFRVHDVVPNRQAADVTFAIGRHRS